MAVNKRSRERYKAIDFFCGGGGMTCGVQLAVVGRLRGAWTWNVF